VLDGAKSVVIGAPLAQQLIVSRAGTDAGTEPVRGRCQAAAGVALNPSRTVDGQRVADVTFTGVKLGADALLGAEGRRLPHIEEASTSPPRCCAPKRSAR
jgi:alkylation response protein AidB-like acyl-CoA dehydrogenase